jgi:glycerate kinase
VGARAAITGEGSLDHQSLRGKAAVGVSRRAGAHGIPTYAVAGVSTLPPAAARAAGLMGVYTLSEVEPDRRRCIERASELLTVATERLTRAVLRSVAADEAPWT